jgi:hypothetical protein
MGKARKTKEELRLEQEKLMAGYKDKWEKEKMLPVIIKPKHHKYLMELIQDALLQGRFITGLLVEENAFGEIGYTIKTSTHREVSGSEAQ